MSNEDSKLPKELQLRDTLLYSVICLRSDRPVDFIPDDNHDYKRKQYWDYRFAKEPSYEWLGTFADCKLGYELTGIDFSPKIGRKVLVVGCGNSSFSRDLSYTVGPAWDIISIDFSEVVINRMRRRHPDLKWEVQDMTKLQYPPNTFDYILDKAAMDALVADEGSSWEPSESACKSVDDMVAGAAKVLKVGGRFSIVSFQPIHFRRRHLERAIGKCIEYKWEPQIKIQNCVNNELGTEFAVFTLTRM